MATGGLGGVHRDAAASFDVSTDLDELARADGALVVCSGMKSILDLPATLESLETRGVLVVGYRTGELPGFLARFGRAAAGASRRLARRGRRAGAGPRALGLPGAIVLAQPVPESEAMDPGLFGTALDTPSSRRPAAGGSPASRSRRSCSRPSARPPAAAASRANCALLVANARLAAEVAVELAARRDPDGPIT